MLAERRLLGVAETARNPGHVPLDGLALGRRRRRRRNRLLRRRRGGGREFGLRVGVGRRVAGDRVLELTHPVPERLPHFRKALAAEEEKCDREDDDDVPGLEESTTHESYESSGFPGGRTARCTVSLDWLRWAG